MAYSEGAIMEAGDPEAGDCGMDILQGISLEGYRLCRREGWRRGRVKGVAIAGVRYCWKSILLAGRMLLLEVDIVGGKDFIAGVRYCWCSLLLGVTIAAGRYC